MDKITAAPQMGVGFSSLQTPDNSPHISAWDQYTAKKEREAKTSTSDYMGSMWRQDGITDGLIAHVVGQQMVPDATYSPYVESEWKGLTEGVWPEFQPHLGQAKSAAHALFLKDRILQKQEDLTRLGDLGVAGNVARFAFGAIQPENLLSAGTGYAVSSGLRAYKVAKAVRGAAGVVEEAAAVAGVNAATARAAVGAKAVASGMAASGVENAMLEKLRQNVNFEDDSTAVLEAGLMGAAFPLPFELAGARAARRVAAAAEKDHSLMRIAAKYERGEELNSAELKTAHDMMKSGEVVRAAEEGKLSIEQAREKLDAIHGPDMPDHVWLERYGEQLREKVDAGMPEFLDQLFPSRVTERTRKTLVKDDFLQLGYDPVSVGAHTDLATKADVPASSRSVGAPIEVTATGVAKLPGSDLTDPMPKPKGMSKLEVEQAIRKEAALRFPEDQLKASEWATGQRLLHLGHSLEVATPIAKGKAAKQLAKKLGVLSKLKAKAEKANAPAKVEAPKEAPSAPVEAAAEAAGDTPTVPLSKEPVAPVFKEGETVGWDNPKTGERQYGLYQRTREDGYHIVLDEDTGKERPIHPRHMAELEAPEGFVDAPSTEGFGEGSVGAAQVAGTTIAPATADVSTQTSRMNVGGKAKPPLRWDIFATLNRSESDKVRELVFSLVKDPLQVDDKVAQAMTASEWKSHIRRTVGGAFHRESREAAREAIEAMGIPLWQRSAFLHEFHSLTTQLTRGDFSVTNLHPTIAPMLQRASAAQRKLYADLLDQMQRAGVKGAEELQPNEFYVNRVWNQKAIRETMEKHGAHNVIQLLADAINVPGLNGDTAKAAQFLHAVQKLEFSKAGQTMHLGEKDMGTLRHELTKSGLGKDEIDTIIQVMFETREGTSSDAGRAGNLKYRFDIGENMSMTTPAGELRISDLFENDARVLADQYLNSIGGHIGLAKLGIFGEEDFAARIRDISDDAIQRGLKGVDDNVRLLHDVYSNIVGRPMSTQDFSNSARLAAATRGYTRAVSLGQLGLTAAFEMKQAVGLMGFRAFYDQLPAFRGIFKAIRDGYFPDDTLARDVEHIAGWGNELSMSYARAQEVDDGFLGQTLNKYEDWSNKASHATDILSGNASFTSLTRQLSSKMAAQRLSDFATGRAALSPKMRERLVGWGVDDDMIDSLLKDLKDHSVTDHRGKLETIDWEAWRDSGLGTYDIFQTVNSRMVRDAIQDQDLGETIPFLHTTLGKVFGELKTFFLVAHAKNMLKNISYMDQTALHVWSIAFIGEALSYATQTSMNYAHDPATLEKRLDPATVALAAMARSPVSGMLPFFVNTGYQVATGGESIPGFGQDMTSSGNGRTLVPPSVQLVQRLWAAPSTAMGLVLDNGNVTRQEASDLWKTLPLSNIYGARNLGDWLTNSLPTKEQKH